MLIGIVILCLAAVAIVLEGCGCHEWGRLDGCSSIPTCFNKQIDIVSQSFNATVTASSTVVLNKTRQDKLELFNITEQMDMENWNYRLELSSPSVKVSWGNCTQDLMIELKFLVIAPQQKVVVWHRLTNNTSGEEITQNCTARTFLGFPTPQQMSTVLEQSRRWLQTNTQCNGNDGTYDKWSNTRAVKHGHIPQVPGIDLPNGSAFVHTCTDVEMDKAYLVRSAELEMEIEMDLDGKGSAMSLVTDFAKVSTDLRVSHATLGGPTASDLDYSDWGTCHNIIHDMDIDTLFQPALGAYASPVLSKISTEGFFQKRIIATVKDSLKSTVIV